MLDLEYNSKDNFFIKHLIHKNLNHKIFGKPMLFNSDANIIIFGMGCFGVENYFGVLMVLL